MCYDGGMRPSAVAVLMMLVAGPAFAADTLAEARRLYNLGQYETAEKLALEAASNPARGRCRACRARPDPARAFPPIS